MNQLAQKSHWPLTLLMGLSSLLNLILPLFLVRILSADQVGQYKILFLYIVTAPWLLLSSGFGNGIYFWISKPLEIRKSALSATWSLQYVWATSILFLGLLIFLLISFYPELWISNIFEKNLVLFVAISISASIPSSFYEEVQIAQGEIQKAAQYSAIWEFLKTASLFSSAIIYKSIDSMIFIYSMMITMKLITSTWLIYSKDLAKFNIFRNPLLKPVFKYALLSSMAAALAIILGYCDQFVLGHSLTQSEYAAYALGCLSIPPLLIFEQSINKIMLPQLSDSFQNTQTPFVSSLKIVRKAIKDLSFWLIPSSIGLFFYAGSITRILFTDTYPESEKYLMIYCFSYLIYIIPFDAWARARGDSKWILKSTALFALISLVGTMTGVHFFGPVGALTAFLSAQFLLRIYALTQMKKHLHWSIRQIIPYQFILKIFLFSLILGWITQYFITYFNTEFTGLVIMGASFWMVYITLMLPVAQREARKEFKSNKILILTQFLHIGGLERMILNLCRELLRQGQWIPSVFVYDEIQGVDSLEQSFSGISVTRKNKKQGFDLFLGRHIALHCKNQDIDQIHAHDLGALVYAVFAKLFSGGRIRVIYTQHSFVHFQKNKKYVLYEKIFASLADVITTVSFQLKDKYIELGFKPKNIKVIENGIPIKSTQLSQTEKEHLKKVLLQKINRPDLLNLFWIINMARLHPGKGQIETLKIWSFLKPETQKSCALFFIGNETQLEYKQNLLNISQVLSNNHHIIWPGSTLEPEQWFQASNLFISASLEEGLPLSPLEALAAPLPIILSEIPGHSFFKNAAHFFPLENLEEAANKIDKLILSIQNNTYDPSSLDASEILKNRNVEKMALEYSQVYFEEKNDGDSK